MIEKVAGNLMIFSNERRDGTSGPTLAAAALLSLGLAFPSLGLAQGLESEGAIETIVGAEVKTDQASADADPDRVIAAIENTSQTIQEVRRTFNVDDIQIVVLTGMDNEESPVRASFLEHEEMIRDLRIAIESSAIFYHAVDANGVSLDRIIALEFDGDDVFIFAAPPNTPL